MKKLKEYTYNRIDHMKSCISNFVEFSAELKNDISHFKKVGEMRGRYILEDSFKHVYYYKFDFLDYFNDETIKKLSLSETEFNQFAIAISEFYSSLYSIEDLIDYLSHFDPFFLNEKEVGMDTLWEIEGLINATYFNGIKKLLKNYADDSKFKIEESVKKFFETVLYKERFVDAIFDKNVVSFMYKNDKKPRTGIILCHGNDYKLREGINLYQLEKRNKSRNKDCEIFLFENITDFKVLDSSSEFRTNSNIEWKFTSFRRMHCSLYWHNNVERKNCTTRKVIWDYEGED